LQDHGQFTRLFQRQIQDPELTTKLNKPTCSGVMLYGPPGCGKTKVAKVSMGWLPLFIP